VYRRHAEIARGGRPRPCEADRPRAPAAATCWPRLGRSVFTAAFAAGVQVAERPGVASLDCALAPY